LGAMPHSSVVSWDSAHFRHSHEGGGGSMQQHRPGFFRFLASCDPASVRHYL